MTSGETKDPADRDEKRSKLLEDIEQFSRTDVSLTLEIREAAKAFTPAPIAQAQRPAVATPSHAPISTAPPSPPSVAAAGPASILAKLKQAAAEKQAAEAQVSGDHERKAKEISIALEQTWRYLNDLAAQLNILKPAYPGSYFLNDQVNLDGLTWQQGRADFRKQDIAAEERFYEKVMFRYVLSGENSIVFERHNPAMESLRKTLMDYGLAFSLDESKNDKGRVEKGRFTIRREVRAGLQLTADVPNAVIQMRTMNIQRLGTADYLVPPDALAHSVLDELAMLLMGESPNFLRRFKRVA